jgi:NADPH:quinone reductase-like Zn-dependent oxidoreductase
MRAIIYTKYGNADVLAAQDVSVPSPKPNEVRIKVQAASINSWDWDLLSGQPFIVRLDGGMRQPKYSTLGADVAGVIDMVGTDVKQLRPGDEVFGDLSGCGWGGFAEYVCAREDALSLKPAEMSYKDAAALPQAGVLALQGLRDAGPLREGQQILLNGAGGGVGTLALQIAKNAGAVVTVVDSREKLELLRSLGADYVMDYKVEDYTRHGRRYDLILDVMGTRSTAAIKRALQPGGTYVMIGGKISRIFQAMLIGVLTNRFSSKKINILYHRPSRADQDALAELYSMGKIVPIIDRIFPLGETPDAMRYYAEGRVMGKVIIAME